MTFPPAPCFIRNLASLADFEACVALQDDTWGHGFSERVPGAILRVAQKIGGVTAGAFDDTGRLMGFVFGMTGVRDGALVHWSDMLAVRPEARGTGLGERLKQFQREQVRALGVSVMFWTADPLVARNAHFNINHLGASPAEYVENMYGEHTGSVLHGAMPTDRVVYRWHLDATAPRERDGRAAADDAALPLAIAPDATGAPVVTDVGDASRLRIPVPHDLTRVQAAGAPLALAWRLAVRATLRTHLDRGAAVTRFVRGSDTTLPYYVLHHTR